jgi:hypothetical protein
VRAAWDERFHAALVTGIVSAAILYFAAFRVALPNIDALWVSQQVAEIADTLRPCTKTPFTLTRYREPSTIFLLGTQTKMADENGALQAMRSGQADFAVFNSDAFNRLARASANGAEMPQVLACINGFHTTRGRKLRLHVLTMKTPEALAACPAVPERFRCGKR